MNKAAVGVIVAVGIGVLILSIIISNDSTRNVDPESDEVVLEESILLEESIIPEEEPQTGKEISVELFETVGISTP